jgi:hypothetical protein
MSSMSSGRTRPCAFTTASVAVAALLAFGGPAHANGLGENGSWQFQTTQDKVNKGAVVNLIERKKGGYYDAIKTTVNNTTYIDRQYNCSVSAGTTGNSGSNGMVANASSPTISNSGSTSSNTSANSATNGVAQTGLDGVLVASLGTPPAGSIGNDQANSGNLSSGVNGSNTNTSSGPVTATDGRNDQVLNSAQTNSGSNLSSTVTGSTACVGPLNAN